MYLSVLIPLLKSPESQHADHISPEEAAAKVKKVNHERAIHCRHFTKTDWGNANNYDLCIKSDDLGMSETAQIIADLFQKKMKF